MFPGEKIHVSVRDSGIFLLPLPERSEQKENWESNVSSAKGVKSQKNRRVTRQMRGLHIRYKLCSLKWFAPGVNKRIKSFEEHHNANRDEREP